MSNAAVYVLLGPPGSGKGTQAKLIAPKLKLPHISLGDLLREAVRSNSKIGQLAKGYLEAGKLVPDEVVIQVAEESMRRPEAMSGFVVDGFPRTLAQAKLFDELLKKLNFEIIKVLYIDLGLEGILKRLTGRRSCRKCGAVYHVEFNPPKIANVCDACGGELYQRHDDTSDVIKVRYEVYSKETLPLMDFYKKSGKLLKVNGARPVQEVFKELSDSV